VVHPETTTTVNPNWGTVADDCVWGNTGICDQDGGGGYTYHETDRTSRSGGRGRKAERCSKKRMIRGKMKEESFTNGSTTYFIAITSAMYTESCGCDDNALHALIVGEHHSGDCWGGTGPEGSPISNGMSDPGRNHSNNRFAISFCNEDPDEDSTDCKCQKRIPKPPFPPINPTGEVEENCWQFFNEPMNDMYLGPYDTPCYLEGAVRDEDYDNISEWFPEDACWERAYWAFEERLNNVGEPGFQPTYPYEERPTIDCCKFGVISKRGF